jgi:hypothetical protein
MSDQAMGDLGLVRALSDSASVEQRAALDRVLARLEAAEKVCTLMSGSFSIKSRQERAKQGKNVYWWDVAGAVNEWEKLVKP